MTTTQYKQSLNNCNKCNADVHPEAYRWNEGLCNLCHTRACLYNKRPTGVFFDAIPCVGRQQGDCRVCGQPYEFLSLNGKILTTGACFECSDKECRHANTGKDILDKRMKEWEFLCPSNYRENTTELINREALDKVMSWKISKRGLTCWGESQRGKTTACWRLIEQLYLFQGTKFIALTEAEFSQHSERWTRSRSVDRYLDSLCNIDLLFLDDLGHAASGSRHLEQLYYVIEKRTSWQKPIISTTQFNSSELEDKAKFSHGNKTIVAILNRLKASSEVVIF